MSWPYVLAIKGNQSKLSKEANAALDKAAADPATRMRQSDETLRDRQELRRAFVVPFKQSQSKATLAGLIAVGRVESWRSVGAKSEPMPNPAACIGAEERDSSQQVQWADRVAVSSRSIDHCAMSPAHSILFQNGACDRQ